MGGLAGNNSVTNYLKAGDRVNRGQAVASVIDLSKLSVTFAFPAGSRDKVVVGANVQVKSGDLVVEGKVSAVGFIVDQKGRLSATVIHTVNCGHAVQARRVRFSGDRHPRRRGSSRTFA